MRVLVVGGEAITRNIIEIVVRNAGHLVVCCETVDAALAGLAIDGDPPYGVVFVDTDLEEDGVARIVQASAPTGAPWLVGISARDEQRERLLAEGAIEVLSKPVGRAPLLACLDRLAPYVAGGRGRTNELRRSCSPTHASLVGAVFDGKYAVEELLGVGGLGAVYRARHVLLGEQVVLKLIRQDLAEREASRARFLREARTNMRINHPGVVAIRDCGITKDGALYMALDHSAGQTLRAVLDEEGSLSEARVVSLARQCAAALGAAHEEGVVHRDLKPENILVEAGDRIRVCDFGLAKLFGQDDGAITTDGATVGTPHYMSPEQCAGDEVDGRSDLYALGCLLFECLTGEHVFGGTSGSAIFDRQLFEKPRSPSALGVKVSPRLDALVARLLAKDPADRPGTAAEVLTLLDEVERVRPVAPSRVLVADDSATSRVLLGGLLTRWGHAVTAAVDGAEAVALATAPDARFDVIILDGTMPGLDGLEAAAAIRRAEPPFRRVPIILIRWSVDAPRPDPAALASTDELLDKPIRPDALQAALGRLLTRDVRIERDDCLDLDGALARADGDRALLRDALTLFLSDSDRIEDALLAADRDHDRAALARAAHELRGVAATCGVLGVAQRAADLERAARSAGRLPPLTAVRRALLAARAAIGRSSLVSSA